MRVPRCDKCGRPAVALLTYSGRHLCWEHFRELFHKRVRRWMRRQWFLRRGMRVLVALSGGKDSGTALHVLNEEFGDRVELLAISVDEGIRGFREKTLERAKEAAASEGVEHVFVTFKEFYGVTTDDAARVLDRPPCSFCGVLRRKLLNVKAKELGADYIALGTNLDDFSQTVLMNVVKNDVMKLARIGPHKLRIPGLVPRVFPLISIPESEVLTYALQEGIPFSEEVCPYKFLAVRGRFRGVLGYLESSIPGTRHSLLNFYMELRPFLGKRARGVRVGGCERCGEPTSGRLCKACQLELEIKRLLGLSAEQD